MLFRRLDWLPLKDELNLQKTSLIFRRIIDENSCPTYITKLLTKNSDRHNYNLVCPSYNREAEGGRSFQVSGAKLWNSIPLDIRKNPFALLNILSENICYPEILSLIRLISVLSPFKSQFPSLCTCLSSFLKFFTYFAYF